MTSRLGTPLDINTLIFNPQTFTHDIEERGIIYCLQAELIPHLRRYFAETRNATFADWFETLGLDKYKVTRSGNVPPDANGMLPHYRR